MSSAFLDLKQKVDANLLLQQQVVVLLQGIAAKLANVEDPAAIAALAAQVQSATDSLSAAVSTVPQD